MPTPPRRCLRGRGWCRRDPVGPRDAAAEDPRVFEAIIEQNVSCGVRKGCLLGNFATELAPHSLEIAKAVTEASRIGAPPLRRLSSKRRRLGNCQGTPISPLARFLVDSYEGAAARAKLIGDCAPMDEFIRTTFDSLLA